MVAGVAQGFVRGHAGRLKCWRGPWLEGETIGLRNALRALRVAVGVRHWLRRGRHRIFHGHSRAGLMVAAWLALFGERRVVVTVHCYARHRSFTRGVARLLRGRLFWLSPAMRRHYGARGAGWEQCVPGGVPEAPPLERRHRQADEAVRLGGIGALVRWKNWELIIAALARLPDGIRAAVRFIHIGSTDGSSDSESYASELRARSAAAGLDAQIEWRGQQPGSRALLREVDAVVVASQNEPLALAMLEALQAGVPVLAADSGGATDVLQAVGPGWLFRSGDAADLAEKIAALVIGDAFAAVRFEPAQLRRFLIPEVAMAYARTYRACIKS